MRIPFLASRSVSLLTWNVWFGLDRPHRRWTELLSTVRRLRPHVIAFQEVTEPFLSMLRKEAWVRKTYSISDPRGESIGAYGNLILSSSPLREVETHTLLSDMDRKAVVGHTTVAGLDWAIASLHLDSFEEAAEIRGRQLKQVVGLMAPFPNTVLLGDFNFCSSWKQENDRIPPDYVDLWSATRSEPGFTVDTDSNSMRLRHKEQEKRVRFDRILVRSARVGPAKAKLIGTKKIRGETPAIFPSDHFGVWGKLKLA
jgi:tyrosyl-DNA phosphodiesterase 2